MAHRVVEKDGIKYLVVGDKAIPFENVDGNGKPILEVTSETKTYPDGRQDCTVHVPCLQVVGEAKKM